jgi:PPM family protein phosphatase
LIIEPIYPWIVVTAAGALAMLILAWVLGVRANRRTAAVPKRGATQGTGTRASTGGASARHAELEGLPDLPKAFKESEDADVDATVVGVISIDVEYDEQGDSPAAGPAVEVMYDDDEAATDEPTGDAPLIFLSAAGQSDVGKRRRRNEDSYLVLPEQFVYVVADGMGGYHGGDVASQLAVETICSAFREGRFAGKTDQPLPTAAAELLKTVFMANETIYNVARSDEDLAQMGTTLLAARFSPRKQRCYIAHVGDSRCYRLRGTELRQLTRDHTLAAEGVIGPMGARLSRAVGIASGVRVDLLVDKPHPNDTYVLCSDGLSKMADDDLIRDQLLGGGTDLSRGVERLIALANEHGGKDNVTVVLVRAVAP